MGILTKPDGSAPVALAALVLIGRSSACSLRIDDPLASGEHARLWWSGGDWIVRDLGSRNGTWVDGVRLDPGGTRRLTAGARLAFGNAAAAWVLSDDSPPVAMARRLATDEVLVARGGMLALPSEGAPAACVFERAGGAWVVEIEGQERPAADGDVIQAGGEAFMLLLPIAATSTMDVGGRRVALGDVEVQLRVSPDEERVEVTVMGPGGAKAIPPRSHHYTLLTMARARLREQEAPGLTDAQRGWLSVEELCRALAMDENRLNVEIYRIRQDFAALGLEGATSIIERRRGSRQLRFAAPRVIVTTMA